MVLGVHNTHGCAIQTAIFTHMASINAQPEWDRTNLFVTHNATLQQFFFTDGLTVR